MRKLINDSHVFSQQNFKFNKSKQNTKNIDAVTNLVEYYHADSINIGEKEPENEGTDEKNSKTINDIIFSLLLINKYNMHMNINSDYEMK